LPHIYVFNVTGTRYGKTRVNECPKLSICIPTYNRAGRLALLVEALASQTKAGGLQDQVEVILSDNASTDETGRLGQKWSAGNPFIHYFRNRWNIGGEPNFIRAIERARGKFVWVLGDDEYVSERALVRLLDYLTPGVTQLYLNFRCIDRDGRCLVGSRLDPLIPDEITTIELIKRIGFVSGFALISSHVFDRELFLHSDAKALLEMSPFYVLNAGLIMAFHDQKCRLVREPLFDYTANNERMAHETGLYVRVMGLLQTLRWLESAGKIDSDFLFSCREIGSNGSTTSMYLREELYGSLEELSRFWALPGRADWQLIEKFLDRGPGFWPLRHHLKGFYSGNFEQYRNHQKPMIHRWRGKAWVPVFSIFLSSDDRAECEAFNELMGRWPEEFAHESILISRLNEHEVPVSHVDVQMAPFGLHRSPSSALNSGFRKVLGSSAFILEKACSPCMDGVMEKIEAWHSQQEPSTPYLIFESARSARAGMPEGLVGLYIKRRDLVRLGGFENCFESWTRIRLLADAAYRCGSRAWAVNGGEISTDGLKMWFDEQLPPWLRILRSYRKIPLSEHGLNINFRGHLEAEERKAS
jgi:glycosyltransferase involved in cell wall biosynthesis